MAVVSRPVARQNRSTLSVVIVVVFSFAILSNIFSPSDYDESMELTAASTVEEVNSNQETTEKGVVKKTVTSGANKPLISRIFSRVPPHSRGKSGMVIHDQLLCHAYAWHRGAEYGGACGSAEYDEHKELLDSIGLQGELPFACPNDTPRDGIHRSSLVPREKYNKDDTRIWIPEYLEFLKTKVKYPPKEPNKFTIAVHIKRGHVNPCSTGRNGFSPYLPNSHYLRLIDKYIQPDARVAIFSQATSHESFDVFESRGYELHLDHPTSEVWQTIAVADVVILSRSSFGLLPSLVSNATVVYTPFWHKPLRSWQVLRDPEILGALDKDLAALNKTCR